LSRQLAGNSFRTRSWKNVLKKANTGGIEVTDTEYSKCHVVIHGAAAETVGAGLAQLPGSDNAAIVPIQAAMIISLAKIFDKTLSEDVALTYLSEASAAMPGKVIARTATQCLIPGIGNIVNAAAAFALTEVIGWMFAEEFANS
jgi:uncharacterized protein (DUF697 family)